MVEHEDASAALAGLDGAHHAGRAGADHDDVVLVQGRRPSKR
jgi:hypothetical protein